MIPSDMRNGHRGKKAEKLMKMRKKEHICIQSSTFTTKMSRFTLVTLLCSYRRTLNDSNHGKSEKEIDMKRKKRKLIYTRSFTLQRRWTVLKEEKTGKEKSKKAALITERGKGGTSLCPMFYSYDHDGLF